LYPIFAGNSNVCVSGPDQLLEYFSESAQKDRDQEHRFWRRNSDVKTIESYKFLRQKLNYVHNNPVQERWALVANPIDYPYSSCRYYEKGLDWNGLKILFHAEAEPLRDLKERNPQ